MKKNKFLVIFLSVLVFLVGNSLASETYNYCSVYSYSTTGSLYKNLQSLDLKNNESLYVGSSWGSTIDMAVSSDAIYAVDGHNVRKWFIGGAYYGKSADRSFQSVTVLKDGTILAATSSAYSIRTPIVALNTDLTDNRWWISGYGGITDIAGGDGVVYAVTGGTIRRFIEGSQTASSANLGITTVAVLPDGNVVGYTGSSLITFDGTTLATGTTLVSGYSGFLDISANADGIFAADGTYVRRFALTGGFHTDISYAQGLNCVAAAKKVSLAPANSDLVYGYSDANDVIKEFDGQYLSDALNVVFSAGGLTDIAISKDGIFAADGTYVYKYSLNDGSLVDTSYASTWSQITIGTDRDVYAYNGNDIIKMSKNDLKAQTNLVSGVGGFTDIAAGQLGIYTADNNYVRLYPYSGGNHIDISSDVNARQVTVGPDGYVYIRTTNQTLKCPPNDLTAHTIIHKYDTGSELKDPNGTAAWRSSEIIDIAVSRDGNYFYAADANYIWTFNMAGGKAVARTEDKDYTEVFVPNPVSVANFDELGVVDVNDLAILTEEWLSSTNPTTAGAKIVIDNTIPQGTATVDGDLSDWSDATWTALDKNYYQTAPDVSSAKYAVRWDTTKSVVYLAVEVYDSTRIFADSSSNWPDDWDESDRLEVYSQGSGDGGTYRDPDFDPVHYVAQQYVMGKGTTADWCVFGATDPVVTPTDPNFAYAITVDGTNGIIRYEVAIPQYDYYGGILNDPYYPTVESVLTEDKQIRFDLVVGSKWGATDAEFGMLGQNTYGSKSLTASSFEVYTLSGTDCGDWGYLPQDLSGDCQVNFDDFAEFAYYWLEI